MHMLARMLLTLVCAASLSGPAWAGAPQDKELAAATKALAGLVADSLAEVEIGKPIHVTFRPLEDGSSPNGTLVPFFVSGQHATNAASEYVAYFHKMPQADEYERNLLKSRKLAEKHFTLVDFRRVGGRGWQGVDWSTAKAPGAKLVVKTAVWKDDDPACCPSGEGAIEISLSDDLRLNVEGANAAPKP
jgi:hypothetical protein